MSHVGTFRLVVNRDGRFFDMRNFNACIFKYMHWKVIQIRVYLKNCNVNIDEFILSVTKVENSLDPRLGSFIIAD